MMGMNSSDPDSATLAEDSAPPEYDGCQPAGGRSQRTLPGLHMLKLSVGPLDNNAYLLTDPISGAQILIDAAAEPDRLIAEIDRQRLVGIVTTHQHPDHWQALPDVQAATGAVTYAHSLDAAAIAPSKDAPTITNMLEEGDELALGEVKIGVIHLRGHTPGGLALTYREPAGRSHIFSGDSLFPGGIGATATPEDFAALFADVSEKIFAGHDDATWVYPGHGNDTTLGAERPQLPDWAQRRW